MRRHSPNLCRTRTLCSVNVDGERRKISSQTGSIRRASPRHGRSWIRRASETRRSNTEVRIGGRTSPQRRTRRTKHRSTRSRILRIVRSSRRCDRRSVRSISPRRTIPRFLRARSNRTLRRHRQRTARSRIQRPPLLL